MEIWVVCAISCSDYGTTAIATFDHSPTKEEVNYVTDKCGGMYCIQEYTTKTIVNDEPIKQEP